MGRLHLEGVQEADCLVRSVSSLASDAYTYPCNPDSPTISYDPPILETGEEGDE